MEPRVIVNITEDGTAHRYSMTQHAADALQWFIDEYNIMAYVGITLSIEDDSEIEMCNF